MKGIHTLLAAFALLALSTGAQAQIDLNNLYNYANQPIPAYITRDNTTNNPITDKGATLGRVLFYDKQMSVNNTIACASCHKQEFAFADTAIASTGVNGTTGRHSMRLVNARFATLANFFWDRRAATLEQQTTMPIQDHAEMGFSGTQGDPDLDSLIRRLSSLDYYQRLFTEVYGDTVITEQRMQNAMAQFVRSIQSFDSKYDQGRAAAPNNNANFNNFTAGENAGKTLFQAAPTFAPNGVRTGGGLGCGGCHAAPEFDIDPNTLNNGVIDKIGGGTDQTNTRSPSLRDVLNSSGQVNSAFMHNGAFATLDAVLDHYDAITVNNTIDPRLRPGGQPQQLAITAQERANVLAFLATLSGSNLYTDAKWSDPFNSDGSLTVLPMIQDTTQDSTGTGIANISRVPFKVYPTVVNNTLFLSYDDAVTQEEVTIFNLSGQLVYSGQVERSLDVTHLQSGNYLIKVGTEVQRFIKL